MKTRSTLLNESVCALWGACCMLILTSGVVNAEIEVNTSVNSSVVFADARSDGSRRANGETSTFVVNPTVSLTYQGPNASAVWNIDHSYLYQDFDGLNRTSDRSFTEYQFSSDISVIDNYLRVNYGSQLRFRNSDPSQAFSDDFIGGSDNLSRLRNNSLSLTFSTPKPQWVGISWQLRGSKVESDRNINTERNLDNNNIGTFFRFTQGDEFRQVRWSVVNEWQDTQGSTTNNDVTTRRTNAQLSLNLVGNFALFTTAQDERNQYSFADSDANNQLREFTSYGAGFEWFSTENRRLSIAYNQSGNNDDDEDDSSDQFVSFDLVWAFSARTRVEASYGRRFFGESGNFSFVYNTKKFRTSAAYKEELTTFTRLISNQESLGVFVCPVGTDDSNECFLPSSLAYQLQPDEQFNNFFQNIPEISEEVILRRSATFSIGFQTPKLTTSINIAGGKTLFLQTNREQNNFTLSTGISYKAGAKTSATSSLKYNRTDLVDTNTRNETYRADIGVKRTLSTRLSVSSEVSYIERKSASISNQLQERRISASVSYTF